MNRQNEELAAILVCLVCLVVGFLAGACVSEIFTVKRMKQNSLEGYKAKATYVTNSLGEVSIDKITWTK